MSGVQHPTPSFQSKKSSPPIKSFLLTSFILIILGWGGLISVILLTTPSGGTRWLFFFTSVLALTGTALPFVAFLNQRFPSTPPPTPSVVLRQAIWLGIYLPTIAWLRLGHVLTPFLGLLLALGLVLVEWLLRLRERSLWKPNNMVDTAAQDTPIKR